MQWKNKVLFQKRLREIFWTTKITMYRYMANLPSADRLQPTVPHWHADHSLWSLSNPSTSATACLSPLRVPIRISAHVEANYWLPSTSWAIKFLRPQPNVTEAARSFVLTRGSQVWQLGVWFRGFLDSSWWWRRASWRLLLRAMV